MTRPPKIYAPVLIIASAFTLGIILTAQFDFRTSIPLLVIAAILLSSLSFGARGNWKVIAVLVAFILLGSTRCELADIHPKKFWQNFDYIRAVRGIVADFPEYKNGRWSATIGIVSIDNGKKFIESSGKVKVYIDEPEKELAYGQLWEIEGSPYPVDKSSGGYSAYLRRQGISGTMWLSGKDAVLLDEDRGNIFLRKIIAPIRKTISDAVMSSLPSESGALLEGMLLGGGRKLPPQTKKFFADTGVFHILAVSGLHIGIVALVLQWLLRKKAKLSPLWTSSAVIFALAIYAMIAQLRPSVLRASIMMAFLLVAPILHRKSNPFNALGAAALFILLFRPFDIFSAGFQLSFTAAGGILYFLPRLAKFFGENFLIRKDIPARAIQLILVTVSAQLGTTPASAYHFHAIRFIAPITNFFIIPVLTPVIAAGFGGVVLWAIFPPLGKIILQIDGILIQYILIVVKTLARFPYNFVPIANTPLWAVAGFFAFAFGTMNILWSRIARVFAVVGLATVILFFVSFSSSDGIYLLGSRHSVFFISKDGENALYFDGSSKAIRQDILLPIYSLGQRRVDNLCLPLSKNTLSDGATIFETLRPKNLFIPSDFPDTILQKYSNKNSRSSKIFSIKFVSQKNCLISVGDRSILVLEAPPKNSIPKNIELAYINFPYNLCDDAEWTKNIRKIIIGKNARGWNKIPNAKNMIKAESRTPVLKIGDI